MLDVKDLYPSFCGQLSESQRHDYGEGASKVRCRWKTDGDEDGTAPRCGLLRQASDMAGEEPFYVWQGRMDGELFNWDQEASASGELQPSGASSRKERGQRSTKIIGLI
jgi:hypothetical protein